MQQETFMNYQMKPLACDPAKLAGLSEKLIVSHYENNYGGAVKRLNAITTQLAGIDVSSVPVFVLNGLKREELIATNSMILHETYFDSLGADGAVTGDLETALTRDFGSVERWTVEIHRDGQGAGRRVRLGAVELVATPRPAHEPVGVRPRTHARWRHADSRAGHV